MDQNNNMGTGAAPEKSSVGIIVSIIVIVLVLAAGAYYFLKQVPVPAIPPVSAPVVVTEVDATVSALATQGTSTNLADIQADLNATNLTGLDAGLTDVII